MRQMKDSGIEWIGQIPEEWDVVKIKHFVSQKTEQNHPDEEVLSLYRDFGVVIKSSRTDNFNRTSENTNNYKFVETGDLVINKMKTWQGSIAISMYQGIVSPAYYVFKVISSKINNKFLHFLLRSPNYYPEYRRISGGIRPNQWDLDISAFKQIPIVIPPLNEQQRIADYLDAQCARIDETMELVRQSKEKLRAYKLSLITEAVTKGLDPDVPMKDSGIPWIGEIPAEWETRRLKYTLSFPLQYGANASGISYDKDLPRYIRITDIDDSGMLKSENKQSLSESDAFGYILDDGDILLARSGATVGKSFLYKKKMGKAAFAGYLIRAKIENKILNNYFFYYITQSHLYNEWKNSIFIQATIQNIGAEKYANFVLPLPPLPEQQRIAAYLDEKCARIDALLAEKDELLDKLAEYKKSLIFECVTGKREVAA